MVGPFEAMELGVGRRASIDNQNLRDFGNRLAGHAVRHKPCAGK